MSATLGRPSIYSEALAERICDLVATQSKGIRRICDENDDLPDPDTIYRWLRSRPTFYELYTRAKEAQLQRVEDEMIEIADDGSNDWMETKHGKMLDKEAVQRSHIRIETRKWLMSKLMPKKYGDRQQLEVSGSLDLASRLAAARKRAGETD